MFAKNPAAIQSTPMDAIATQDLCKSYGAVEVLHGVDLRVPQGSLFGFLGPNGAGKTTTIRILLGLLRATRGAARVFGRDAWEHGAVIRRDIGYLPGDARFYDHLTGRQTLRFLDSARGGGSAREILRLSSAFALDLDKRVRRYSRGTKQKLGLVQALMHRPRLLILDEPTTALDPLVRRTLADELRAVVAEGRTVLFSSHTLAEVEQLCDFVAIVRDGRLIEHNSVETLRRRAVRHVEAHFDDAGRLPEQLPRGLRIESSTSGQLVGTWTGTIEPLLAWLAQARTTDVTITPPSLEELFLEYYADGSST